MQPRELDIHDAATELNAGRLSAVELVSSCLERIEEANSAFNALIHQRAPEQALTEARETDERRRRGERLGLLDGIPISLKANFACTGLTTSAGSKILADWQPTKDASAVAALRRAGAVILGMANMHEFADGPTNENPHYGRPLNPHDRSRTPGGSSGGSAVALATNMCLGATGTDDGGSIRIPAAFCGVVGLKPTHGLVSVDGVVPFSRTLDHAGPLARTPGDAIALLRGMIGQAPADFSAAKPDARIVVGVERDYFGRHLQPGVRRAFHDAIETMSKIGFGIQEVTLPRMPTAATAVLSILFPEAAALHHHYLETRLHDYAKDVRRSLLSGRLYRAVDYINAQEFRAKLRDDLDNLFDRVDVLVTPTAGLEAPRWDDAVIQTDDGEVELLEGIIRCTAPFNLTGHPAMSIPCGTGDQGLPVGLQLVGPRRSEVLLADVADAFLSAAGRP